MFWEDWKHITKLDPDKKITERRLELVIESGTDAIMISGTQNITNEKISNLISMLGDYKIPKILEPVDPKLLRYDGVDHVFVPSIINTDDSRWFVGRHKEWIKNHKIRWDMITPEAYLVLNPDSAVCRLTGSKTDLSADDVAAYAKCAEKYFNFPVIYVEYSGAFGDPKIVRKVRESLDESTLFYGGGIDSKSKALEMRKYADTIVVGNVLYDDLGSFMETIP